MFEIIGESLAIRTLRSTIARVAPHKLPVLILGPTGAGKEVVARALHRLSGREGKFVGFNVCACQESLFEPTLFGHVRGAYTGAVAGAEGYLSQAHRGTLFLDEIGGLPLAQQSKLLRAIETGEYRPVGASNDRHSEFRLIAAANEPIDQLVEQGGFRSDLAHRLAGVVIRVPALKDRKEDIALLARYFAGVHLGQSEVRLSRAALRRLEDWDWPGNVRELRQVIERAIALSGRGTITESDIIAAMSSGLNSRMHSPEPDSEEFVQVLERFGWDTAHAADYLGIHRSTVYRRMERLGIASQIRRSRSRLSNNN